MRVSHRWRSIERKLPLLILCLESGTIAALTLTSFQRVERVMLASAGERLQSASIPVALLLEQSGVRSKSRLNEVAADPALTHYLLTGNGAPAARAVLARAWTGDARPNGHLELRRRDGTVVLDTTAGARGPGSTPWIDATIRSGRIGAGTTQIGPFATIGDSTVSQIIAAVGPTVSTDQVDPDQSTTASQPLGYITNVAYLSTTGVQTIRDLIGAHVTLLLGSFPDGDWTDLERPASRPPAEAAQGHPVMFSNSPFGPGVGAATPVRGTPWTIWVQQPRSVVLATMHPVVVQLAVLAVIFLIIGAIVAWVSSRRITKPIVALTEAAEQVSPESGAQEANGQDEIARLADAFRRMAARVTESQEELESRVRARTRELQHTLGKLEDAQEQLVQKERLAMLGQLASAVGHELRNPLGVMTNALYVIENGLPDAPELVREYIGLLRGQIAASERIIGDLLDTARSRPPQTDNVPLWSHVEETLKRLGALPRVEVNVRFPPSLPPAAFDPDQLTQILLNLFSNAIQAMGESPLGTLTVSGYVDAEGHVCLSVTDTGPGMTPDVLNRIFEPLFTTKARGLGLGLWVSRTLARANGAELSATSQIGHGSCFTLSMVEGAHKAAAA